MLRLVSFVATWLVLAVAVAAQSPEVRGRITDPSGLPLPGVAVTLTGTADGSETVGVTDDHGEFVFRAPPGRYRLTAELAGFDIAERADIALDQDTVTIDLALALTKFQDTVTVHAVPISSLLATPLRTESQGSTKVPTITL